MDYVYTCKNKEMVLTDEDKTQVEHGRLFCVVCDKCCKGHSTGYKKRLINVPVLHLLYRKSEEV